MSITPQTSIYKQSTTDLRDQLILDLESDNQELRAENTDLRARIAELEESPDERIAELQRRIAELQTRHYEQVKRYEDYLEWMCKLFANKTIPEACRLVLWQFYYVFFRMRNQTVGEELRIGVEHTAAAMGISTSTVSTATKRLETWEILKKREEKTTKDNGDPMTLVHITLNDAVEHPENIRMANTHGGARVKKCSKCGSEDVDRYTVQYCRHCDENSWYGQPGLRADADVRLAQNASNTPLYKSGKKQDAFEDDERDLPEEPSISSISSRLDQALAAAQHQTARAKERAQKQDAFDQAAGISSAPAGAPLPPDQDQLEAEHTCKTSAASCYGPMIQNVTVCQTLIRLNKDGTPAHGLDKVVSSRSCGSTQWQWSDSDQRRVCAKCWTPQPHW